MWRVQLFGRALRWRAALSAAVLLVAVVVVAGAALGPVFALAAAQSGLRDTLVSAASDTGIRYQGQQDGLEELDPAVARRRIAEAASVPTGPGYPKRIRSLYLHVTFGAGSQRKTDSAVVWRDGACAGLRIVAGRCPEAAGEVIAARRSGGDGWRVGAVLPALPANGDRTLPLRVVGQYEPVDSDSPRWSGQVLFDRSEYTDIAGITHVTTDTLFTVRATFDRVSSPATVRAAIDEPMDPSVVRLAQVPALRARLAADARQFSKHDDFGVTTRLGHVLDRAASERARIDAGTATVVAQLCLLGWLVLFQVLVDAVEARSADIALAKLRGFGRPALLRFGLGEPFALLAIATPVGIAVAWLGGRVLAERLLLPGTPVALPAASIGAAALAFAGGAIAIALSARRALRRGVVAEWRRTRKVQGSGPLGLLVDLVVVAGAIAAFVALRVVGPERAGVLVLLGPGLLVLAAGLLGARLLGLVLRPLVPLTAWRRAVPLLLAVRQVVRRPAGLRLVSLLTVAAGLAVFGVGGAAVAAQNRTARASAEIGASEVQPLLVEGGDPVAAVRDADPDGRWAMAVARWLPDGGDSVRGVLLAVDADRLRRVASPAFGLPTAGTLTRLLRGAATPPVTFTGTRLSATVVVGSVRNGPLPTVRFTVVDRRGRTSVVAAGSLRSGSHSYTATVPCGGGCRITGIVWDRSVYAEDTVRATVVVTALRIDGRPIRAYLSRPGGWHALPPSGSQTDRVSTTAAGTRDRFVSEYGGSGGIATSDVLDPAPAVVTPGGVVHAAVGAPVPVRALYSAAATTEFRQVAVLPVLPVVLDDGLLVDVRSLQAALPSFADDATWTVWIGPDAPRDATARLRAAGLVLDGPPTTIAHREAVLARQGPALALLLLVVTAIVGALTAMIGTVVSIGAAMRRRSYEAAALTAVRIPRRQVLAAAVLEQLLLLGTAVVVGLPAGVAAILLALPVIPQSSTDSPVPLQIVPAPGPVLAFAFVFTALVLVAGTAGAVRVVRAGGADRLREAEE